MEEQEEVRTDLKILARNFLIELLIYGALVVGYFFLVLRLLGGFLTDTYQDNLLLYAILALVLIVAQGVLLESVTTFLLDQIKLERLE